MAFENSSASSPVDLVQKLNTFLVANGWTSNSSAADGAGWRVHLHKGSQYVHLRASMNEVAPFKDAHGALGYSIGLYVGTSFVGGNAWNAQVVGTPLESMDATKPVGVLMRLQSGSIPNYYFFTDSTNAHVVVVVECLSGIFTHMGWGASLSKVGSWTGGDYFFATFSGFYGHDFLGTNTYAGDPFGVTANCPGICTDPFTGQSSFVRADVDSWTGKWIGISDSTTDSAGYTGKNGSSPVVGAMNNAAAEHTQFPCYAQGATDSPGSFQTHQTSLLDGRADLLPVMFYAQRDGSGGPGFSPLGTIPTVFVCSGVGQGYSPASDYAIGSDTYTVFPQFAVKKVV